MPTGNRPDTPRRQNGLTDPTRPAPIRMNRSLSLALLALLLTLSGSAWSHEYEAGGLGTIPGTKPLNLSLPPQPTAAAVFGSFTPGELEQGADLNRLPDLGQGASPARQARGGRLPYGSGYEARQRASTEPSSTGFGMSGGSGARSDGGFGGHQGAGGGPSAGGGRGGGGRR